jgi:hypothetical protein
MLENGEAGPAVFVSMLQGAQWMDLQDVQAPDIIFHVVRQLVDDLAEAGFSAGQSKFAQFFNDIKEQLNREVELQSLKVPAGIAEFGLVLKEVPFARATLRRLIEGRMPTIFDLINREVLRPAREWLKKEKGADSILVIVDELDRIPRKILRNRPAGDQINLFIDDSHILQALQCHLLYTIPVELALGNAHLLRYIYGCPVQSLPIIPVSRRDGHDLPEGLSTLRRIVNRRISKAGATPQQFCEDPCLLEDLCRASGGHVRNLFVLLTSALDRCDELPMTGAVSDRAIRRQAIDLSLSLRPSQWGALRHIHASKEAFSDDPELWNGLLSNLLAFAYEDEHGVWYDWNPLLAITAQAQQVRDEFTR